jgi:hypothetical protein
VVVVANTSVHNFGKNGITGNDPGTYLYVGGSSIIGDPDRNLSTAGPFAAQNGIQVGFGAQGELVANNLANFIWPPDIYGDTGDAAAGILIYASKDNQVFNNIVANTQFGIFAGSGAGGFEDGPGDGNIIDGNVISNTHLYDAIDLCSNKNLANLNTIYASDESAIHLDDTCPGASGADATSGNNNDVSLNLINESCIGIMSGTTASGNKTSGEIFSNVVNTTMTAETPSSPGTPFCAPPQSTFTYSSTSLPTSYKAEHLNASATHGKPSPKR